MTKQEYFRKKLNIISVFNVSDDFLTDWMDVNGIPPDDLVIDKNSLDEAFLDLVLSILLKPDVSEGDLSIKYDRSAVLKWYSIECSRLDLPNPLDDRSFGVEDVSYLA